MIVGLYMYMRLIGYPGEGIAILSSYNAQKNLLKRELAKHCEMNPLIGMPKVCTTIDKFQGQQADRKYIGLHTPNVCVYI